MTDEVLKWIRQEKLIERGDTVLAGVSGGADSVCLLLVLRKLRQEIGFTLSAVHVEHGIRGEESRADEAFTGQLCAGLSVPLRTFRVDVPGFAGLNGLGLEEAARTMRYDCFQKAAEEARQSSGRVRVALAHHADDNAETVLFRMIRGSGLDGLCGMRPKRRLMEGVDVIRPLLGVSRADIEAYLKENAREYRTDRTNFDMEYSRNRLRRAVLPELEKINRQAVLHINQCAGYLCRLADYMEEKTGEAFADCCMQREDGCCIGMERFFTYPELIQTEIVHRALTELSGGGRDVGRVHVEAVMKLFGQQVGRSVMLAHGITAKRTYGGVVLRRAEEMLSARQLAGQLAGQDALENQVFFVGEEERRRLEAGESVAVRLPGASLYLRILPNNRQNSKIQKKKYTKWLNYDKIKCDLQIRKRASGDYLTVDEAGHRKKLKDYFINEKVPQELRDKVWLLAEQSHIVWVIGGRISAAYKVTNDTKRILEVRADGGNYLED